VLRRRDDHSSGDDAEVCKSARLAELDSGASARTHKHREISGFVRYVANGSWPTAVDCLETSSAGAAVDYIRAHQEGWQRTATTAR
jgi:hypothetical protein